MLNSVTRCAQVAQARQAISSRYLTSLPPPPPPPLVFLTYFFSPVVTPSPSFLLLSPFCSLARDEAATLTWRRDVGVRAIAAVLGHGASGKATLDGSGSSNHAAFGVPNVVAPSLSHRQLAPAVSPISTSTSQLGSKVSLLGELTPMQDRVENCDVLQVDRVEMTTHEIHNRDQHASPQHKVQHQEEASEQHNLHERHHQSSPSPSRVSSSIPRSILSELSHRSPSPCSLTGSSSSLRAEPPLRGFSSRLRCLAMVANVFFC
jgi:hypothetical protein